MHFRSEASASRVGIATVAVGIIRARGSGDRAATIEFTSRVVIIEMDGLSPPCSLPGRSGAAAPLRYPPLSRESTDMLKHSNVIGMPQTFWIELGADNKFQEVSQRDR